jgi:hypothetical protein
MAEANGRGQERKSNGRTAEAGVSRACRSRQASLRSSRWKFSQGIQLHRGRNRSNLCLHNPLISLSETPLRHSPRGSPSCHPRCPVRSSPRRSDRCGLNRSPRCSLGCHPGCSPSCCPHCSLRCSTRCSTGRSDHCGLSRRPRCFLRSSDRCSPDCSENCSQSCFPGCSAGSGLRHGQRTAAPYVPARLFTATC